MAENNHEVLEAFEKLSGKVGDVAESVQTLATHMDKRFDGVDKRFGKVEERIDKVESVVGNMRNDLMSAIDKSVLRAQDDITKALGKQLQEAKGDIVKEIKTERERAKLFDTRVLTVLERNKLVVSEEAVAMRESIM